MAGDNRGIHAALDLLSRRDRSEAEVRRRLREKGITDTEIDAVLDRLRELNYLDDRRLADRIATAALCTGQGYGVRLALDLAKRGIPRDISDETLTRLAGEYDQQDLVRDLLTRKFPAFNPATADNRGKARVMNFLLRRGFSRSAVFEAMKNPSADFAD
jgi:regulatory protein